MTLKYDEFFVTPSGTVEIRRFLPGKKGKFEQTTIGRNGQLLPGVFEELEEQDGWSLNLWNEVQLLLEQFPYPAHAYVFGISRDRETPSVTIEFQIPVELPYENLRCWVRTGGKRWGWEAPRGHSELSLCIGGAFEKRGIEVGTGFQITYFPVTLFVTNVQDAREKLEAAEEAFNEVGIGQFIQKPKPWHDAK